MKQWWKQIVWCGVARQSFNCSDRIILNINYNHIFMVIKLYQIMKRRSMRMCVLQDVAVSHQMWTAHIIVLKFKPRHLAVNISGGPSVLGRRMHMHMESLKCTSMMRLLHVYWWGCLFSMNYFSRNLAKLVSSYAGLNPRWFAKTNRYLWNGFVKLQATRIL